MRHATPRRRPDCFRPALCDVAQLTFRNHFRRNRNVCCILCSNSAINRNVLYQSSTERYWKLTMVSYEAGILINRQSVITRLLRTLSVTRFGRLEKMDFRLFNIDYVSHRLHRIFLCYLSVLTEFLLVTLTDSSSWFRRTPYFTIIFKS